MKHDFTFGFENEFMLVDSNTYKPLSINDLNFCKLREFLLSIPCNKKDIKGFKVKEPNKCNKPYYVEGYDFFKTKKRIRETMPKGLEIRTPIRHSILAMIQSYHQLFNKLNKEVKKLGYNLCQISHHPTKTNFRGPQSFRKRADWIHEQGAVFTYGPDINIGIPETYNSKTIDERLQYYAPAMVAFTLNSPVYRGKLWKGKSIRIYKRALTGPVYKYHKKQNRYEFKNFDVPMITTDIINNTLLFLIVLLDDTLPVIPNKSTYRKELRTTALKGWTPSIQQRARILLEHTERFAKKEGFSTKTLRVFKERLEKKQVPADTLIKEFKKSKTLKEYLHILIEKYTNIQ